MGSSIADTLHFQVAWRLTIDVLVEQTPRIRNAEAQLLQYIASLATTDVML